ncbi:M3 family metallopeptidase [Nocardioides iriomotensis]|uniref:Peptidase M3 n=1 Tax=Nocardioides iriomotensis TaxID=715784 RepID=A0A4Q5J389_9ACTN|nr:M3 family metallopeptidase [Nocardioides iriomotensis]RYU13077.1 peptidase M3 [Nocardioides iriomotensis]
MTDSNLSPLTLPESDAEAWVADRTDTELARAAELVATIKAGGHEGSALELWNDVNIALGNAFAVASLMSNVHPDEAVRNRAEAAEQAASKLLTEIGLDRELYEVLDAVDPQGLDDAGRRVLTLTLRDFRRAGVDQDDDVRARLKELSERQTEVGQEFSKNIRNSVLTISLDPGRLDGLPADYVEAHAPGDDGQVTITTEYPDYVPFMTFATDRDARAALLHEFRNRAWPENDGVLEELLTLRAEQARLLGYADWPSYDAEVKMIGKGSAIPEFIDRIADAAEAPGRRDVAVLLARLQQDHPDATAVDGRDGSFYAEVIRRENFDVDAQLVRTYFDFQKVRAGLLDVTGRLFGIEYVPVDVPVWHEDVATYDVLRDGERLGRIHLDLHPRPGKYSHAAQFDLVPGIRGRQLPQGVLVCNFSKQLMEHDHVVTLFHEFGHLVHHVLAGGHDWARFSGVATEWDFVEAPSQMLEEWAWDHDVLKTFATDASGAPIPAELVAKMRAANEFGKGYYARTQMFYAATSYYLHQRVPADLTALMVELQAKYDLFGYVPDTHFHTSFGHLHGYGSGYYTYMWSLVIAKDLFSAFDPDDMFDTTVAHRYRDRILAAGGSKDAADLVADFLGRPYHFDAFEAWLQRPPG